MRIFNTALGMREESIIHYAISMALGAIPATVQRCTMASARQAVRLPLLRLLQQGILQDEERRGMAELGRSPGILGHRLGNLGGQLFQVFIRQLHHMLSFISLAAGFMKTSQ
jgi:hypothetical protein